MDPEVSETVRAFYGFSIEGDCWHCLSYCFVVQGAPQGLRLAWVDLGLIYHAFHIKGFQPEWYVLTIYQCRDIPYWWETLVKPSGTLIHRQTTVKSISPRGSV